MSHKRSKGVTFWAWFLIVTSIYGIFITIQHPARISFDVVLGDVTAVADLACGIFLLQLKEAARKATVFLCFLNILLCPISVIKATRNIPAVEGSIKWNDAYTKEANRIKEQMKPEYQQEALAKLEKNEEAAKKFTPLFMKAILWMSLGSVLILNMVQIYFFTRPKVKEQFLADAENV